VSMAWIRQYYGVPAKRGGRILFEGQPGVITSARGAGLRVRMDGEKRSIPIHPVWEVVYLAKDGAEPRVWHAGDPEPEGALSVRDRQGDTWERGWRCEDSALVSWEFLASAYGPLTEAADRKDGA
jgi:hypothetical protein